MALHRRCTSVRFSIQHTLTPACDGRPRIRGRLVGQWYQFIKLTMLFIHLGDTHSKQWAALNASSLCAYLVDTVDNIHKVQLRLIYRN